MHVVYQHVSEMNASSMQSNRRSHYNYNAINTIGYDLVSFKITIYATSAIILMFSALLKKKDEEATTTK